MAPTTLQAHDKCYAAPEAGFWEAPATSKSIKRVLITSNCDGRSLTVRVWLSCSPRDCYTGAGEASIRRFAYNPHGLDRIFFVDFNEIGIKPSKAHFYMQIDRQTLFMRFRTAAGNSFGHKLTRIRPEIDVLSMASAISGIDFPDNDLPGMPIVLEGKTCQRDCGRSFCKASCAREDRCFSWTYVPAGIQGDAPRCWLKGPPTTSTANPGVWSGVLPRQ